MSSKDIAYYARPCHPWHESKGCGSNRGFFMCVYVSLCLHIYTTSCDTITRPRHTYLCVYVLRDSERDRGNRLRLIGGPVLKHVPLYDVFLQFHWQKPYGVLLIQDFSASRLMCSPCSPYVTGSLSIDPFFSFSEDFTLSVHLYRTQLVRIWTMGIFIVSPIFDFTFSQRNDCFFRRFIS